MSRNHVPPQAYTTDTLAKAFEWLKSQPGALVEAAKDADTLVGLYLQAKRRQSGLSMQSNPEEAAPVSSKSFKEDLRQLAHGLRQFDAYTDDAFVNAVSVAPYMPPQPPPVAPTPNPLTPATTPSLRNDPQFLRMINDVRTTLGLQSENEILRMLVTMGYTRFKSLFKES